MAFTVDLGSRCALVTGASRGIGRAVAIALAEAGAGVAVNYLQRRTEADAVVDAIRNLGGRAVAVRSDVSDSSEVAAMVTGVERELGPIDILVIMPAWPCAAASTTSPKRILTAPWPST